MTLTQHPSAPMAPRARRGFLPGLARSADPAPFWTLRADARPPEEPFIALVPGADVPLVTLDLPSGLKGAGREAVARRRICDMLGLSPDGVTLRPAPLAGQGALWQAMLLVPADLQGQWDRALAGTRAQAMLPDYLALPAAEGMWTIRTGDAADLVQMRLGLQDGASAEPALAARMLAQMLADLRRTRAEDLPVILRLGPPLAAIDDVLAAPADLSVVHDAADLPRRIAQPQVLGHGELALDLMKPVADAHSAMVARLRAAIAPALLVVAGGIGWAGYEWHMGQRAAQDARAQQAANLAAVRADFIPDGPLLDIRAQVSRVLAERRAGAESADAAPVAGPLARLFRAAEVLATSQAQLEQLRLDPEGRLELQLSAPDLSALERLDADLRAADLTVRAAPARRNPDGTAQGEVTLLPVNAGAGE